MKTSLMTFGLALAMAATIPACATPEEEATVASEDGVSIFKPRYTPALDELAAASRDDLEALYASGKADIALPLGKGVGRAFFLGLPGLGRVEEHLRTTRVPTFLKAENILANLVWSGKQFSLTPAEDGESDKVGTLTNSVLGLDLATADIRHIPTSLNPDENDTYYLDYSKSDLAIVRGIQDYIRHVGNGLFVGKAFITLPGQKERILACYFALDFGDAAQGEW